MIDESLLSVGSCVKVANNSKMIMIAGYLPYDNQKKMMYDYIGIYLPIGIRKSRQKLELGKDYICIKGSDIEKVVFMGFSDNKSEFYRKYLLNMKNKLSSMNLNDLSEEKIKRLLEDSLPNIKEIRSEV